MTGDLDLSILPYVPHGARWMGVPTMDTWTWTPASLITLEGTPDELDALQAAGWQRFLSDEMSRKPDMAALTMLRLRGQLADLRLVRRPGQEQRELWARTEDIARIATTPVELGFSVSNWQDYSGTTEAYTSAEDASEIRVIQMLPPPQFGEIAIVFFEDEGTMKWQQYTLAALGEEGIALWQRLGAALKALAAPADWLPYNAVLAAAITPEGYEAVTTWLRDHPADPRKWPSANALGADSHVTPDEARSARLTMRTISACARAIQTARQRAEQDRDGWLRQWHEIQQLGQELAALYWQAHQATIKAPVVDAALSEATIDEGEALRTLAPVIVSESESEEVRILTRLVEASSLQSLDTPSYAEDRAAREATLAASAAWNAEEGVPRFQASNGLGIYFLDREHPLTLEEAQAQLLRIRKSTVVTNRIAQGLWNLRRHNADLCRNGSVAITYDEILEWRGVPKHTRAAYPGSPQRVKDGYRPEDRNQVREDLRGPHTVMVRGRAQQINVDGPYCRLSFVNRPTLWRDVSNGANMLREEQLGVFYSPGDWVNTYEDAGNFYLAEINRRVFQLHPHHEQHELQLALFLTDLWRIQAHKGRYGEPIAMSELLRQSVIRVDRPNLTTRFAPRIEQALENLHRREIIGEYACLTPVDKHKRNWGSAWLAARWRIIPPPDLIQGYIDKGITTTSQSLPPIFQRHLGGPNKRKPTKKDDT